MATLSTEDRALIRLYTADPAGPKEVLSDAVLQQIYEAHDGSFEATVAQGWRIKAANVSEWYLVNADGAFLSRDQVFDHCIKMAQYYELIGGTSSVITNVRLEGPNAVSDTVSSEF